MCLKTLAKTPFALRNDSPPRCLVIPKRQQLRHPFIDCWRLWNYLCKSPFYVISNGAHAGTGGTHQSVFIVEGIWMIEGRHDDLTKRKEGRQY